MKKTVILVLFTVNAFIVYAAPVIYQAEDGVMTGGAHFANAIEGYQGTGYVEGTDDVPEACSVTLNVTTAGMYNITIGYRAHLGDRNTNFYVNGYLYAGVTFTGTTSFSAVNAGQVYLPAGVNELKLDDMWAWLMLDWFGIEPVPAGTQYVSGYDLMPASVSTEQQDVYAIMYTIKNPSDGISVITGITLTVKDAVSNTIPVSAALSAVEIRGDSGIIFQTALMPAGPQIYCNIPAGVQIEAYSEKNIYITADITSNTATRASEFKIGIDSPFKIEARDFFSGNTLTVAADAGFSFPLESSAALIQNAAKELALSHLNTMPAYVSTEQKNVKAMELQLSDVGNSMTASVKISKITLYVQDSAGNHISALSAVKSVKITGSDKSVIYGETTAGAESKIAVVLTAPLIVAPGQLFTCAIMLDMVDTLNAASCKVSLESAGDIYAVDANSSAPVLVTSPSAFPKESSAAVIQEKADNINIDNFTALLPAGVVKGQKWVELFDFRIYDTLGLQSAQANFNSLTITVKNSSGIPAPSNASVEKFYITDNSGNTLGSAVAGISSDTLVPLVFPVTFTSGASAYFRVFADILTTAYAPDFKSALQSADNISITDANSGYEAGITASPPLPWETGAAGIFTAPATDLYIWHNGNVAPTLAGPGQPDVKFMEMYFYNPGGAGTGSVEIKGVTLAAVDMGGGYTAPASVFESTFVTNIPGDITYAYHNTVSDTAAGPFYVPFSKPVSVDAMNTKNAYIAADILISPDYGTYRLRVEGGNALNRISVPAGYVTVTAVNSDAFPMDSNHVTITALANDFKVSHSSLMPVSVIKGAAGVEALAFNFENYNSIPIAVTSIALAVKSCEGGPVSAESVINTFYLKDRDGNIVASAAAGSTAGVQAGGFSFTVAPGSESQLKAAVDIREDASVPFYLELVTASDIGTLPAAAVNASDGDYFGNMKSGCVSLQEKNLELSYHVFPNPADPSLNPFTIEYYLENSSEVTAEIYTVNGNLVRTVVDKKARAAGLYLDDKWDGKNEAGKDVRSGLYLCVIEVKNKVSGQNIKLIKKIAVLR